MKSNVKTFKLVFSALMVAFAVVLSLFKFELPYGGSITIFSMVPLVLIAQMYGVPWGLLTCTVFGAIKLVLGLHHFSDVSGVSSYVIVVLFDYILAYAVIGFSGVTRRIKNRAFAAGLGAFIGCMLRYACHIVSGLTVWKVWAEYWDAPAFISADLLTPEKLPYTYAVTYNGLYMVPDTIITIIGAAIFCTIVFEVFRIDTVSPSERLRATAEANASDAPVAETPVEAAAEPVEATEAPVEAAPEVKTEEV